MWLLVAAIFVIGNPDPVGRLVNKTQFPTEAACLNFFDTEAGAAQKTRLETLTEGFKVKYTCEKAPD